MLPQTEEKPSTSTNKSKVDRLVQAFLFPFLFFLITAIVKMI